MVERYRIAINKILLNIPPPLYGLERMGKLGKINFYGIGLDLVDTKQILNLCDNYLKNEEASTIFFLNAHYYNLSCRNDEYRRILNKSTVVLNDGIGVKLGLKLKKLNAKENMNGTDLIPKIIKFVEKKESKIFLLGAKNNVITKVPEKLKSNYPNINIVGFRDGYFKEDEEEKLIKDINNSGAEIIIIGMGAPYQEIWIERNKSKLKNIKIIIAGGAIFDFISEEVSRAPLIIRNLNLEWFYRFILEPKRLFRRYIVGNIEFFFNIFSNRKTLVYGDQ